MKRKLFFITFLMLFCSSMFGQHWTMTEADIVKYAFNTTVNAAIKIQGQTPENIEELEIAAFHNGVLRGVASPVVETLTGQYVAYLVVYSSDIGELITFKLYDPSIDKEYDTDYTINFTQTVIGEPIDPVIINFYTKHWNYVYNPEENYMALPCIIKVDGNLIDKSNYEIAAFSVSGNQLRGVANPELEPVINIYKAMLKIDGTNGEKISFKLFDVDAQKELETDYTISYDFDYFAGDVEIEFKNNPVARIGEEGNAARYFATLEAAVAAAQDGETVVLLQDVNLTETLTIEKNITLDLNEKNVTLSTGGNMIKADATIKNGNVIIDDVDTKATANSNCFISVNVDGKLTFYDIVMTGSDYTTDWAVLCAMSSNNAGSTINILNSTVTLSNEKGSRGGFIKDQSGVDNYSQINISNSTLTLTNVSRGFTGAKVTLNDVDLTITGGEHGINGSELVIKNGSNVSISNGTGRAITLNKFDASIAGSNVTISNMGEGGIRYKTANTLTVDASSKLSETTAHADVDNAKLNDKVVRGTESQMSTVKVEDGVTTVINPVSGQVAYRAYIEDSENREAVKVDLQNVNALNSLAVKLYDANGNLLTTTTYRAGAVEAPEYLTCNIVLSGTASSSWETVISAEKLTVDNYPHKAELVIDGSFINTFENILGNATDAATYQLPAYKALGCVYKAASITREGKTEYYGTLAAAVNAAQDGDVIVLLNNVSDVDATISKKITLNLNEKIINDAYIIVKSEVNIKNGSIKNVNESYPLVVQDSGKLTVEGVDIEASKSDRAIWVREGGELVFNSGSILATKGEGNSVTNYITAITISNNTNVTINGGTITVDTPDIKGYAIFGNYENANVTVNGGKISTSGKNYSYAIYVDGDITVTGGEIVTNEKGYTTGNTNGITNTFNYAINTKGNVNISGGTFTTKGGHGYIVNAAGTNQTVNISGGSFTNVLSEVDKNKGWTSPALIKGQTTTIVSITDGNFTAFSAKDLIKGISSMNVVSGGTFDVAIEGKYIAPGFKLEENENGTYGVVVDPAYGKVAKIGDTYYETLADAIAAVDAGNVVIELVNDATLDYNAREAYGTAETTSLTINGNGKTLTLNQKNSDWSSFGLANADAKVVFNNMTIEKTGYGDTSGAWNTHTIIFSSNVEMTDVTVNNSMAVQNGATLTNVTINEANGYYGLWINGNGQSVTMNGGSINATNGGRGIKIADQYVGAPALVTLSVTGTTFNTAEKAAVLVSSKAGAVIAASNVNIENVAEDKVNFAWVDEDWAAHYGEVTVTGGTLSQESVEIFNVTITDNNNAIQGYYKNIATAIADAQAGETVNLLDNYSETLSEVLLIDKSLTINGNGKTLTSSATRVIRLTASEIEVTINNLNMVSTAVRVGTNDVRGISIDIIDNVTLTLNNCSVDFIDASANDWAYAVNVTGGNDHKVTVNGGSYEGANVINVRGASNIIVVNDATLNCTYPNNDMYYGACIWVLQNQSSSVEATGNTFNGGNAVAFNLGTGTDLTESNNTDNTTKVIAKIGNELYVSLQEAIDAATEDATIVVLHNIELTEGVVVAADKTFTLDLNGKVVSGVSNTAATSAVITNNGNLTVKTSVEGGKITSKANNPDQNSIPAYANNTITNCGVLTLLSGTIENSTEQGLACFPIDNNSTVRDAVLNINGGIVTGRGAIRQFANSNTNKNEVNVTAGTVTGTSYAIWVQNPGSGDPKASLNIKGGELSKILMDPNANFEGSITGGTITEVAIWEPDATNPGRNPSGFITGGTFGMDVTEFCAFNYVCTSNGDGTYGIEYKQQENNAFVISTLHELEAFRDAVNAGNTFEGQTVVLSGNVDLAPTRAAAENWIPIGTIATPFKGTFDGGDNTISDLNVVGENNVGLFGYADNATIKNVKIENANVKGTDCVGVIAGSVYSKSTIENCHISGLIQVEGLTKVGGIHGYGYAKIINSSVVGNNGSYVKGTYNGADKEGDNVGGIVGHGGEGNTISACTVKNISVIGTRKVGGIVGTTDRAKVLDNCLVDGIVIENTAEAAYAGDNVATTTIGGLIGNYHGTGKDGSVINCVVKNVTFNVGNAKNVGPIVGGYRLKPNEEITDVTASGNLVYMSTITDNTTNMYLMNAVAKIDETKYYTLQEAVDAGNGETINVIGNTTEVINIADNAVIDLNFSEGVTLNGYFAPFKGNLTINGGTINNENASYSAIEINAGTLVLNDVKVTSKRHGVRIDGAVTATINGGEYTLNATSGTRHAVNVSGAANVTIKAGKFVGPKGTSMDSGSAVCVQSGATVTIEGGDFSKGKNATLGVSGTMIVKGGTFDQDPSAYLADAYTVNIENEMYVVRYTPIMVTYPVGNPVYPEGKVEYYSDMLEAVPYTTNCPRLEGATITLLADVSGAGMRFMENDMVFDLNGHTYTITAGTGSQGTNTSGFQIRPEVTTNVLFKNGTIKVAEGAPVAWMFNCYATDFIVENVTVDCSNMAYSYGDQVYVVVSREGDNVQLTGETKIVNFNSDVAGNAINVGGTMTIGEEVDLGVNAVIKLGGGAQLTAPAGLNVVTVEDYMVVYENGVYKSVKVVAKVGDVNYESVAAAMTAAKEAGVKDLEITIIGENTQDTDDSFNLIYATAFDNVTIKQNNGNKPFYIESIYTGDRTSADGKFVFDGVNMIITEQIWFECDVVLTNNSSVKRSNDVKNFIYYGEVTVEPGSKYISQIDDVFAGSFTVDGGKTDGTYNEAEDFKTVFFDVRDGHTFTAKNGANILISSGEGGKLSLMGNANIDASKVYVYNEIALGDNGKFAIDIESSVTTKNVTGKGVISVDALNINEGVVYNVITANMSSFAGIIEINNDDAEYEITSTGLVVKMKPFVAEVDGTQFTSLQGAFEAVQDNGTITLLRDVTFDLTTVGYQDENWVDGVRYNGDKSFTVNFNTYKVTDNGCVNDYLININNKGEKDNEITFTNGTIESANGCWATVCVGAESSTHKTVLNLNDMNIINKNDASYSGNLAVRVRGTADVNTTVNVNTGTTITSDGASYGIAPSTNGAVVNINSGAIIEQKNSGTSGGNSVFAAVGGKGTVNIYDGAIIGSDSYGVHTMTTGTPVVNIYGGTITAEVALKASTNGVDGQSSTINVSGGMITGALEEYTDNAQIILTGGTFSTDVNAYCHEYYDAIQGDDNLWRVEQVLFAQTTSLQGGWNWFSSYVDLSTPNGLEKIQTALGTNGDQIKTQGNQFSFYQNNQWISSPGFTSLYNDKMYMIKTTSDVSAEIIGSTIDYANTVIVLNKGWNWISYPLSVSTDVNEALEGMSPADGDIIKGYDDNSTSVYYLSDDPQTPSVWWPAITLEPGQGYMYKSNTNSSFIYTAGDGTSAKANSRDNNYWVSAKSQYANNMTMIAMLSVDNEIVKGDYEIAAFANGECRGSARPIYNEHLDAYVLLLTVYGDEVEELTFKYYDVNYETEYELSNRINYSNDAVVGSIDEPYMFNLDILNIGETSVENISIYPNPTTTGSEINLQAVCDKVEVFNALGVKVAEYTNVDSIDAIETAGVYVIRLTIDNSARNCRLIVK